MHTHQRAAGNKWLHGLFFLTSVIASTVPGQFARAEDAPASNIASVPGDDVFGFTTPTDPGNPGDLQYFNENDGRFGKRNGGYGALNSKFALGYTFTQNWWIGFGAFAALNHTNNIPGLPNLTRFAFDGLSVELLHRVVERSEANPFAATISIEPRWGRVDGVTGLPSTSYQSTFKLYVDAPLIKDTLYWAGNVQFNIQANEDPMNTANWQRSSTLLVSSALTYQFPPALLAGAELRFFTMSDNLGLSHEIGRALYLGPTIWWKATDKISFNATLQPQIYGRSNTNPGRALDLDNFERAQFRVKMNVAF